MKVELVVIGRTMSRYLQEGVDNYVKRLGHYVPLDITCLPDVKSTKSMTEERQKELEGVQFLDYIKPGDRVMLLDEKGREMTSREFAGFMDRMMSIVPKRLLFIVGGPYGFSKSVYDRADGLLSLSKMTFSHEMIRLFFTEQLYRAMTILRGEPYHHD